MRQRNHNTAIEYTAIPLLSFNLRVIAINIKKFNVEELEELLEVVNDELRGRNGQGEK